MQNRDNLQYPGLQLSIFNFLRKISYYKSLFCIIFLVGFLNCRPIFSQPLANGKNKFVGNVIHDGNNIHSDFLQYWNQVTPENAGKWGSVEGAQGSYNWTQLNNIYNYAIAHNFPFKFHNLIWGSQQPSFMSNIDSVQQYQEIVNWIDSTGQKYPDAAFCDVVNEPIHTPPAYKNALGGNGTTGWDWVIKAFELARQYWSPSTKLLINEYSVINDPSANAEYIQIINLLKSRGLIDGIGVQAHYFEVDGGASLTTLKTNLDKLAATGLPIYISEFDINQQDDNTQLQRYQSIFPMLYEDPGVRGITLWGYTFGETWKPYTNLLTNRPAERPALQWLRTYLAAYLQSVLISPIDTTDTRNPLLVWQTSTSATQYHVQVATDSAFLSTVVDSTVTDTLLQPGLLSVNTKYYWHVIASNAGDTGIYSAVASFTTNDQLNDVTESKIVPKEYALSQNYPNPFNPTTIIRYSIPQSGLVTLNVYDLVGQKITTLVSREQAAGTYEVSFDASKLASGIYFYRIESGRYLQVKKMMLIK